MQVTPESLQKDLQWITGILCTADFIAIDCEMTGLGMANDRLDFLDSLQERYTKVRTSAEQFQLVQYGICAFKWESESKAYVATPLNAFIFPKASSGALGIQKTFVCQASSLEFLKSHSFDFNAWIEQGLSYVSMQEEAIARTRINKTVARDEIPIDEKNSEFVETTMNTIRDWLQNSTEATLMLTAMNAYQRRLVYQETPKRFNHFLAAESGDHNAVRIRRMTADDKSENESRQTILNRELDRLLGFRQIIDVLFRCKKPIIGHNMLLDMCHTYQAFCGNLPNDVEDFKDAIQSCFPVVFDTKHMANIFPQIQEKMDNTTLGYIMEIVEAAPFHHPRIQMHDRCTDFSHSDKFLHSAGYDAYATGLIFLKMAGLVSELGDGESVDISSENLAKVANKLHLMRSDIPFVHIDGEDDVPDRQHVFRISNFPSEWKISQIQDSFKSISLTTIKWIDSTAAWVILRDATKASIVLNWCDPDKKKKKRLFDLEPYHTIAEKQRLERRPNQDTPEKENEETKESDKVPAENTQSAQTKPKEEPDESKLVAVSPTKRSHDEMEAQNEGDVVAQPQAPLLSKRARRDPKDKKGCIMS